MNDSFTNATSDPIKELYWTRVALGLHPICSIFGILGNSLVVVWVLGNVVKRTPVNVCFANQAVADLLVALSVTPFVFFRDWAPEESVQRIRACQGIFAFCVCCVRSSIFATLVISVKRWGQIVHWEGGRCHAMSTMKGVFAMIAVAWLCSALSSASTVIWSKPGNITLCSITNNKEERYISMALNAVTGLAVAANAFFCLKLLHYAVTTLRAVQPESQTTEASERVRQNELRLHNTIVIIIAIQVLVWVPAFCVATFATGSREMLDLAHAWVMLLVQLNSVANPFVYAWRAKSFRESVLALLPARETMPCWRVRIHPEPGIEVENNIEPACSFRVHRESGIEVRINPEPTCDVRACSAPAGNVIIHPEPACEVRIKSEPACEFRTDPESACEVTTDHGLICEAIIHHEPSGEVIAKPEPDSEAY